MNGSLKIMSDLDNNVLVKFKQGSSDPITLPGNKQFLI